MTVATATATATGTVTIDENVCPEKDGDCSSLPPVSAHAKSNLRATWSDICEYVLPVAT